MSATHHVVARHSPPLSLKKSLVKPSRATAAAKGVVPGKLTLKATTPTKAKIGRDKPLAGAEIAVESEDEMATSFLQYWYVSRSVLIGLD